MVQHTATSVVTIERFIIEQERKFPEMYALLSQASQDAITQERFVQRYRAITEGATILTIQTGLPVARIELLDTLQVQAVNLHAKLGLEVADHLLGVLGAARQVDRHAAEHHDIAARRRHLARRLHADVVGLVDLVLAAHHDGERGDHERDAIRHDLVEFVRKDFGCKRRGGVTDAGAVAVHFLRKRHGQGLFCVIGQ